MRQRRLSTLRWRAIVGTEHVLGRILLRANLAGLAARECSVPYARGCNGYGSDHEASLRRIACDRSIWAGGGVKPWTVACSVCGDLLKDENGETLFAETKRAAALAAFVAGWDVDLSSENENEHEHVCPKHLQRKAA